MKKIIFIIAFCFILLVTACKKDEEKRIYNVGDVIECDMGEIKTEKSNQIYDVSPKETNDNLEDYVLRYNDITINGKYESTNIYEKNIIIDHYSEKEFDENGNLIRNIQFSLYRDTKKIYSIILDNYSTIGTEVISIDECQLIAEEYIKANVDINDYVLTGKKESNGRYAYTYRLHKDDMPFEPHILVYTGKTGILSSIFFFYLKDYSNFEIPNYYYETDINKLFIDRLNYVFEDRMKEENIEFECTFECFKYLSDGSKAVYRSYSIKRSSKTDESGFYLTDFYSLMVCIG